MSDDTKALIAEAQQLPCELYAIDKDRSPAAHLARRMGVTLLNVATALTEAEARAERRYAVLKAVEWIASDDWDFCPVCARTQQSGHEADCALAAALLPPPAGEKPQQKEDGDE
jgi:hypothetical protein